MLLTIPSGKSLKKESSKLNILQEEIPFSFLMLDDLLYILTILLVHKTLQDEDKSPWIFPKLWTLNPLPDPAGSGTDFLYSHSSTLPKTTTCLLSDLFACATPGKLSQVS